MTETLRLPSFQVQVPGDCGGLSPGAADGSLFGADLARSSSSTPTLRRRRFKMRRTKNVLSETEVSGDGPVRRARSGSKEYLQLPSIEITPSSDEDAPWSNCSTPSASPRRKRFLLKKWLKVRERKEHGSESSVRSLYGPLREQRHGETLEGDCCRATGLQLKPLRNVTEAFRSRLGSQAHRNSAHLEKLN